MCSNLRFRLCPTQGELETQVSWVAATFRAGVISGFETWPNCLSFWSKTLGISEATNTAFQNTGTKSRGIGWVGCSLMVNVPRSQRRRSLPCCRCSRRLSFSFHSAHFAQGLSQIQVCSTKPSPAGWSYQSGRHRRREREFPRQLLMCLVQLTAVLSIHKMIKSLVN